MKIEKLLELDQSTTRHIRLQPESSRVWWASVIFAHSGDSWFWLAFLAIVFLFGNQATKSAVLFVAISICVLALFIFGVKLLIRRQRPPGSWGKIYRIADPHSFPSGHAARAFLIAYLCWIYTPTWLAVLITLWAILVCFSRVSTGLHYISDILAGSVIGIAAGAVFIQLLPVYTRVISQFF